MSIPFERASIDHVTKFVQQFIRTVLLMMYLEIVHEHTNGCNHGAGSSDKLLNMYDFQNVKASMTMIFDESSGSGFYTLQIHFLLVFVKDMGIWGSLYVACEASSCHAVFISKIHIWSPHN